MAANIQETIQSIIDRAVADGKERGLQFAVYHQGRLIVDACAGIADINTGAPVTKTTLFPVFSTTKGITAAVMHMLAKRGLFSYDDRISKYWPEFGKHGKENITIRQALNHTAGIPQLPVDLSVAETADWDKMITIIESLRPIYEPGTRMEYHALNYGWILGELARRVDGRPFGQIVEEDICKPLGITGELYVGCPADQEYRVAFLEDPGAEQIETWYEENAIITIPIALLPLHTWMNRSEGRICCQPAGNGVMTARAIARVYASLLPGGVDGVELLPPARIEAAIKPPVFPNEPPQTMALGFGIGTDDPTMGESPLSFGHYGAGGSFGFADPQCELSMGYTHNLFSSGGLDVAKEIADVVRGSLKA